VWWRREDQAIDRETAQDALAFLMKMDAKLDRILRQLGEDVDGREEADPT
jgi:hypothetical protein